MASPQMAPFCGKCGSKIVPESKFCEGCGAPVAHSGLTDYTRVKQVYHAACEIEPSKRDAWLVAACHNDASLLAELRNMFATESAGALRTADAPAVGSANEPPGQHKAVIGPYRLLREIGRGGMGVVYLAVRDDGAFRKNVALKLLLREHVNPEFISRFRQERQVLAALDHPNIARILDGGNTPDEIPYYVMEFVEGLPLDKYCDQQRLSLNGRIKIFQQVCQAVDYLHSNSIMHRDLKPSNILVSADGVVKLLDFGIAKVVGAGSWSNPDLTNAEARPMTPTYASPEQIAGVTLQKTSDLYSLGAILYTLLTGRPAYQDLDEKLAKLEARQLPPKPSTNIREDLRSNETTQQIRRAMMGELDSIVLMAMHIDPKERYQSALAIVEDLQHFLDGAPVTAHHGGVAKRSVKLLRRKSAAVAVAVALLLLGAFGVWQSQRVERNRAQAVSNEAHLKTLLDRLEARVDQVSSRNEAAIQDVQQLKSAVQTELTSLAVKQPAQPAEQDALIARSVKYLDRVRAAAPANPHLNAEVGDAYQQLGNLQAKVVRTPSDKKEALKIYQKAATALVSVEGSETARVHLEKVNDLIESLGGTPVAPTPVVEAAAAAPTEPVAAARPVHSPAKAVVHRVDQLEVDAPPPPAPAKIPTAVQDALVAAESKAAIAEQTLAPLKQSLERDGQTLNADTMSRLMRMRASLDKAKRSVADGDAAGAQESITITENLANKLLQSVGR